MSWAKFDDNYDSNPKILAAGLHGKSLHATSIRWSRRLRTDGAVVKAALIQVGILAQLPAARIKASADVLVTLNLWEDHGDRWMIHDYACYGPPSSALSRHDRAMAKATLEPWPNHGPSHGPYPSPSPSPGPVPVSLEQLRDKAIGRGVVVDTITDRLAELQQLAEGKGAVHWIPYVLTGFQGQACLFDQWVVRWLEDDHSARGRAEHDNPGPLWLPDKRPA